MNTRSRVKGKEAVKITQTGARPQHASFAAASGKKAFLKLPTVL
jgi:hypothetical protein